VVDVGRSGRSDGVVGPDLGELNLYTPVLHRLERQPAKVSNCVW
jgi:hypothetical protein